MFRREFRALFCIACLALSAELSAVWGSCGDYVHVGNPQAVQADVSPVPQPQPCMGVLCQNQSPLPTASTIPPQLTFDWAWTAFPPTRPTLPADGFTCESIRLHSSNHFDRIDRPPRLPQR